MARSTIHERTDGRGFYVYARPDGKRRQVSFTERADAERFVEVAERDGDAAAVRLLDTIKRARSTAQGSGPTVADLAAAYAESRPKASTAMTYARAVRYIEAFPAFATLDVASVTVEDVEAFVASLRAQPSPRGGTLAPATVRLVWSVLLATLDRAVRAGHVPVNRARQVEDRPKAPPRRAKVKPGTIIDATQLEAIVERIPYEDGRALFRFLFASGLRLGEALALRWADMRDEVDDDGNPVVEVTVARSQTRIASNEFGIASTKSGKPRVVAIRPEVADEVRALRGDDEHDGALVWKRSRGAYGHQWINARAIAGALGEAPAGVRIHDLRHSRATYLLLRKVPAHLVSEAMGHASVAFTLDTYAHSTDSARRSLAAI